MKKGDLRGSGTPNTPTNPDDWFRAWDKSSGFLQKNFGEGEGDYTSITPRRIGFQIQTGKLCKPNEILSRTRAFGRHQKRARGTRAIRNELQIPQPTHRSCVLEQLKRLRGKEVYSAELDIEQIIESISKVELNDLVPSQKVALARLVLCKDGSSMGPIFFNSGKIRIRSNSRWYRIPWIPSWN